MPGDAERTRDEILIRLDSERTIGTQSLPRLQRHRVAGRESLTALGELLNGCGFLFRGPANTRGKFQVRARPPVRLGKGRITVRSRIREGKHAESIERARGQSG